MAKGCARMGMMMISSTPGHWVKQLEVRMWQANGQTRLQLAEVAIKEPVMKTLVNPSLSSSPTKQSRSPSKHQFLSKDGVGNVFDMNYPPVEPMRLPCKKHHIGSSDPNDYIHEWLPKKEDFLQILLDLEAPPLPHICKICGKDGVIQQWTGDFFKDSALHMTSLLLHLGHDGAPCPSASVNAQATTSEHTQPVGMDEGEWEDIDYIPLHLHPQVGSKYLTVINVTGVHFVLAQACQCVNAESYHMQLFHTKLYPSTFERPSMAFTFLVLDDFLRDNVECGTSGMNYYSKLCQVTSSVFPHLVADQYWELLQVAQQWCLLKLLKWSGFQDNKNGSTKRDLALFCVACPQPRINLSPQANLHHWRYTRTVVMGGNFKAEHMHEWQPDDQVWLMDGCSFMVGNPQYQEYIEATPHITEKSACNNHKVISQASASHRKLNSTGVGATACAWHGCFYPHSVVDFQKGEGQLNMDYSLCNALNYNMNGIQNVICFYDINCTYMKNLQRLNQAVPSSQQKNWQREEEATLNEHICNPSVMDIFEIQLTKVHGVELHLLQTSTSNGMHHGAASWLTHGLVIEEAEIALAINQKAIGPNPSDLKQLAIACCTDRVAAEQTTFITDGRIYLQMDTTLDGSEEFDGSNEVASENVWVDDDASSNGSNSNCSGDDMLDTDTFAEQIPSSLPLPSNLGADKCCDIGMHQLAEMELELQIAQANDALHGLCLALADKAVIFRSVVRTTMIALQGYKFKELAHRMSISKTVFGCASLYSHYSVPQVTESTGSMLKLARIVGKRKKNC
ncbi:hypothetical protein EDD16DRAFT_1527190 [Pisolithus croceorrhizus]|nr:hypothetical protein EDD16DRAFT_1527190 [Pisolithus croceorrhizus]